jgi:hypothetical protein
MVILQMTILADPEDYTFYFRLGNARNFPEGFQIGTGRLYSFNGLSVDVQKRILSCVKKLETEDLGFPMLIQPFVNPENDWYMKIEVEAIPRYGLRKAEEKAEIEVKQNLNLIKLFYEIPEYYQNQSPLSLYEKYYEMKNGTTSKSHYRDDHGYTWSQPKPFSITFERNSSFDIGIQNINSIITNKDKPTDLDRRILNVLDIIGMIDESTPLHIRFMLFMTALEGLLLSNPGEDYARLEFAEKITFLIGDSEEWLHMEKSRGKDSTCQEVR